MDPRAHVTDSFGELPELLQTVARACGLASAAALARAHGGRRLWPPKHDKLKADNPFARSMIEQGLTLAEAAAVAELLGRGYVSVPLGPFVGLAAQTRRRRDDVRRLLAEGRTKASIAGEVGTTERSVYRIQADAEDAPELPLFRRDT